MQNSQYTVRNHRLPGNPVVIRVRERSQVLGWQYMRISVRCLDRVGAGLRRAEQRARTPLQYSLLGPGKYFT